MHCIDISAGLRGFYMGRDTQILSYAGDDHVEECDMRI